MANNNGSNNAKKKANSKDVDTGGKQTPPLSTIPNSKHQQQQQATLAHCQPALFIASPAPNIIRAQVRPTVDNTHGAYHHALVTHLPSGYVCVWISRPHASTWAAACVMICIAEAVDWASRWVAMDYSSPPPGNDSESALSPKLPTEYEVTHIPPIRSECAIEAWHDTCPLVHRNRAAEVVRAELRVMERRLKYEQKRQQEESHAIAGGQRW